MQCAPSKTADTVKNPRATLLSQKRGESLEKILRGNRPRNGRLSNRQLCPENEQRTTQQNAVDGKWHKSMFAHPLEEPLHDAQGHDERDYKADQKHDPVVTGHHQWGDRFLRSLCCVMARMQRLHQFVA